MPQSISVTLCGETATITLNRPKAFNAFDLDMISDLAESLTNLAVDDTIKIVAISGEGKAFCAGGDLRWAASWAAGFGAAFHTLAGRYHQAVLEIRRMPKPVIAAINGMAAGGGFSLALACDFRIMAESAVLRQAYTSNGLSVDGGGTFMLPRLVGAARAMEICAFDRPIPSGQALTWGLVTEVVKDDKLMEAVGIMAANLTNVSLRSLAKAKQLLNDSFDNSLETQLELERAALRECAAGPDGAEGVLAFLEKRKPLFNR